MLEYDRSKRKWILYTRDGSRILGTHKTKKDALRQERAITAREKGYRIYYHGTNNLLEGLNRESEIFLAADTSGATFTAASVGPYGARYIYEVYVPLDLVVFDPRSVFRDEEKAQTMAAYLEDLKIMEEEELEESYYDYYPDLTPDSAVEYFFDKGNYTDIGLQIMDACGGWSDVSKMYWTFVFLWPNSPMLGRYESCLKSFGYEGRFEQEEEMSAYAETKDCSLCVFDQRKCILGEMEDRSLSEEWRSS